MEILLRVTTPRHLNSAAMQVHAQLQSAHLGKLLYHLLLSTQGDITQGRVNNQHHFWVTTIFVNLYHGNCGRTASISVIYLLR